MNSSRSLKWDISVGGQKRGIFELKWPWRLVRAIIHGRGPRGSRRFRSLLPTSIPSFIGDPDSGTAMVWKGKAMAFSFRPSLARGTSCPADTLPGLTGTPATPRLASFKSLQSELPALVGRQRLSPCRYHCSRPREIYSCDHVTGKMAAQTTH